jgi:hypothetical protein
VDEIRAAALARLAARGLAAAGIGQGDAVAVLAGAPVEIAPTAHPDGFIGFCSGTNDEAESSSIRDITANV